MSGRQGSSQQQQAFTYSSEPQAVPSKRSARQKYRPETETGEYDPASNNIMYDRRVVRGNTYAAQVITQQAAQKEQDRSKAAERDRRMRREMLRRKRDGAAPKPMTPPPVPGRAHMEAQTDNYLEELTDRPEEREMETQTEAFLERPPSPLFVAAKTGVDKATEIATGDLFNFDEEVVPILEVVVGKTLHLAMVEVMEEEEIAAIKRRQRQFQEMRNAELAEIQRIEAESKRRYAEKQRRLKQEEEQRLREGEVAEKVAARSFTHHYLASLHTGVFQSLQEAGHFYDPLHREVSETFLPWVVESVSQNLEAISLASQVGTQLLTESICHARQLQEQEDKKRAERTQMVEDNREGMVREEAYMRQLIQDEIDAINRANAPPEETEGSAGDQEEEQEA